jgi:putative hydroxymethylpyrimidine transport system substrate-binding protein
MRLLSRSRSRASLVVGLVGAALLATGCGGSSSAGTTPAAGSASDAASSPAAPRKLTVLLDWFPNPDHVALYVAQQKGYFADAGLDVTLQAPSDPTDPPKLVSTGKVELGISYEPEMFFSKANDLDVMAVGALIPTALNSIISIGSSSVTSPADLGGKTVGNSGQATDQAFLDAVLKKNGIAPGSVKNVTVKTSLVQAMLSGNVDATIGGYRNIEGVQLTSEGKQPRIFPVTEAGVPDYQELVVIAQGSRLAEDAGYQQLVRDFLTALAKGGDTAREDPAVAESAMKGVAKDYDPADLVKMIEATVPLLDVPGGFVAMDPAKWDAFGGYLKQEGLIEKQIPASDVMTTDYLPKA